MKILVINCGSSSIKYQLFEINKDYHILAKGLVERIGISGSVVQHSPAGKDKVIIEGEIKDHKQAMIAVEKALTNPVYGVIKNIDEIDGVGHRVVHGGEKFHKSTLITEPVLKAIQENSILAPLHNPPNITGIQVSQSLLPNTPNVAVFDTAIHQTMPKRAYLYGLPIDLYKKHGIRKYGFHGTSHGYVAKQAAILMNKPFDKVRIITCHIGNGGSIAAFEYGKVIDTSMGLTPLEGIVMGTRCGDIDPAVVLYLMETLGLSLQETNDLLNKKSGLLGLCGHSDMRDILAAIKANDENAKVAVDVLAYRVMKYVGSYVAAMKGVDAIVFTAGIGEYNPWLREKVISHFAFIGAEVDVVKNNAGEKIFSTANSKVYAMMIPTNEELVIAQDTYEIINNSN
jgi:acetate kinase